MSLTGENPEADMVSKMRALLEGRVDDATLSHVLAIVRGIAADRINKAKQAMDARRRNVLAQEIHTLLDRAIADMEGNFMGCFQVFNQTGFVLPFLGHRLFF